MLTFSTNIDNNYYTNYNSKTEMMSSNPWYPPPGPSYNFTMDHPPSNSREMRNRAEKMRRDKLNAFIGELATLVPMVARSAKRMDKTSILRLTATHLRIYQTLMNGKGKPQMDMPKQIDQFLLEQLVCEQLGGFLLILTPIGKIVFVSHTVENLLGHLQTDLMGQSIFNITSPDDHERLKTYISIDSTSIDYEWRKYFNVRLKRAGPRTETPIYEPVRVIGVHRHFDDDNATKSPSNPLITTATTTTTTTTTTITTGNSKSSSSSSSSSSTSSSCSNNDILLLFVRVIRPEPLCERLLEASKDEYMTRHLIDGRIINCDQRISLIAGYMTDEVSGISAFKFMHRDDVRWVMIALRQMYDRGESKGSSCYRLLSRNGQFIYLRTLGFLEIDDQGTVESFVCINTLVSEKEGRYLINEMKRKFSAMINNSLPNPILPPDNDAESAVQSVEDPQKIEAAIIHLITNLPSPGCSDQQSQEFPPPPPPPPPPQQQQQPQLQQCSIPSPGVNYENQDIINNTTTSTIMTDNNSPNKSYHMKLKTAPKRPPSTDTIINDNNTNKRQKTQLQQQQQQPLSSSPPPQYHQHLHQHQIPLYHQGPQIADSTTQNEQLYQQHDRQKMLHNV